MDAALHAHTDLNVFHAIQAILEGGTIYSSAGQKAADRIIKICQNEAIRQVTTFDRLMRNLK